MEGSWCLGWVGGGGDYSVVPLLFVSPQTRNSFLVALFHCTC